MKKLLTRLFCSVGYHSWTWKLHRVFEYETEPITGDIPDRAICSRCGIKYK